MVQVSTIMKMMSLAALPVGAHALWTSRFMKSPECATEPQALRVEALRRVRRANLTAYLTQLVVMLANLRIAVRAHAPLKPELVIFIITMLIHHQIKFKAEKKLRSLEATARQSLKLNAVGMAWGCFLMLFVSTLATKGEEFFTWAAHMLGMTPVLADAFTWSGVIIGMLGALYVVFLASPIVMRKLLPSAPLSDPTRRELIESCFQRAGLPVPDLRVIEMDHFRYHNAMIVGMAGGTGRFKPSLFVARSLFSRLDDREFEAMICHEVSHIKLAHMRKRLWAALWIGLGSVLLAVTLAAVSLFVLKHMRSLVGMGLIMMMVSICAFAPILLGHWLQRRRVRDEEMEADLCAVFELGADVDALCSALRKLDTLNDLQSDKKDPESLISASNAHPTTEERIKRLQQHARNCGFRSAA